MQIMANRCRILGALMLLGGALQLASPATQAATVIPLAIYNVGAGGDATEFTGTLTLSVTSTEAIFTFANTSSITDEVRIGEIYFESGLDTYLTGPGTPTDVASPLVDYNTGATPADPPANALMPGGVWTSTFASFQPGTPTPNDRAVNPGESLTITFGLDSPNNIAEAALAAFLLEKPNRIALHINACTANGTSCEASAVPVPAAAWLLGSALPLLALIRRSKAA